MGNRFGKAKVFLKKNEIKETGNSSGILTSNPVSLSNVSALLGIHPEATITQISS